MTKYRYDKYTFSFSPTGAPLKLKWDGSPGARAGVKFYRAVTEWLLLPEAKRLACLVDDSALQSLPELTEELPFDAAPAAEGGAFYLSTGGEILNPDDAYISLQAAHAAALCAAVLRPGERYEILQRLGSTSIASQATTVWAAGVNAPTN